MNILFLTLTKIRSLRQSDIYSSLLREFVANEDEVFVISPYERRETVKLSEARREKIHLHYAHIGNYFNTKWIEKGITTVLLGKQYKKIIKRELKNIRFDLILYSTPPITLSGVIKYLKQHSKAITYLMLKDIWPQSMADMETLSKKGIQGLIFKYFQIKEKQLYENSDYIGCMSPACERYLLEHNKYISCSKVELCPNAFNFNDEWMQVSITKNECNKVREKYHIPSNKIVFVFGGNIGNGHDPGFLEECIKLNEKRKDYFILIVGRGVYYNRIKSVIDKLDADNTQVIPYLPQEEYIRLISVCDVGMIILDHRFTCPNYPSRLISYLVNHKPVIVAQDEVSDIGPIAQENGYGYWCESTDAKKFVTLMDKFIDPDKRRNMGEKGFEYLKKNYNTQNVYRTITNHVNKGI